MGDHVRYVYACVVYACCTVRSVVCMPAMCSTCVQCSPVVHCADLPAAIGVFIYAIRVSLGGVVFGYIMAKLTILWLVNVFNDALTEITITLASTYLTFYIGEEIQPDNALPLLCRILLSSRPTIELFSAHERKRRLNVSYPTLGLVGSVNLFLRFAFFMLYCLMSNTPSRSRCVILISC